MLAKREINRVFGLVLATIVVAMVFATAPATAFALIIGGEGNSPVRDPGWPAGAADIFNHTARIAWWEGPPFGGGQWHAECRGDAKAFNEVLAKFAKLEVKNKRLVVHDGIGHSFWLNTNRQPDKEMAARMDWMFMVWQPANWERLRRLPADLNPTGAKDAEDGPPAQIDVYTGGNIKWSEVKVPEGIAVTDNRLEAHGFKVTDGQVLEGTIIDGATKKPLAGRVLLEKLAGDGSGSRQYEKFTEAEADKDGRWVAKNVPAASIRVVASAEGFLPRVVAYAQTDGQPRWNSYAAVLAKPGTLSGKITDEDNKPLADVDVLLRDVVAKEGGRYESVKEYRMKTDADGGFYFDWLPVGSANITPYKPGYVRPGLGAPVPVPSDKIALQMMKSASVQVVVGFGADPRPSGYVVHIAPEEGPGIGKWSGSGNIDAQNKISFEDMPPGKYRLHGRPNPGADREQTEDIILDLKGGETREVVLTAKKAE